MRLLDTNVLSEIIRPHPDPRMMSRLFAQSSETLFASEITRFELRRGACLRADTAAFWSRLQTLVLPVVTWLPVTQPISMRAAELSAELWRTGREIGMLDPFLAATALEHNLVLVTRNVKHFERILGLDIENWFEAG